MLIDPDQPPVMNNPGKPTRSTGPDRFVGVAHYISCGFSGSRRASELLWQALRTAACSRRSMPTGHRSLAAARFDSIPATDLQYMN